MPDPARETMVERLMRETREADEARAHMKGKPPMDRLVDAARRSIEANGRYPVGKDGRTRLNIAKVSAEGDMAAALRELGVLPPVDQSDA